MVGVVTIKVFGNYVLKCTISISELKTQYEVLLDKGVSDKMELYKIRYIHSGFSLVK